MARKPVKKYEIYGNTVRTVKTAPKKVSKQKSNNKAKKVNDDEFLKQAKRYKRQKRQQLRAIEQNNPHYFMTVICIIMTLMLVLGAIYYLNLNAAITEAKIKNKNLMQQITIQKAQNDNLDHQLNDYINIENILKIAREELHMIDINPNNVIFYDRSDSEYMHQNEDIPPCD